MLRTSINLSRSAAIIGLLLSFQDSFAEGTAILPANGRSDLAGKLDMDLERRFSLSRPSILGPLGSRSRLETARGAAEALVTVETDISAAEKALLFMNGKEARRRARQALADLSAIFGRFHCPHLVARARGALALAMLLEPIDQVRAIQAFRAALEANPGYRPDPDRLDPKAARLFRQAREGRGEPRPPEPAYVKQVAAALDVSRLVWLSMTSPDIGAARLTLVLFDEQGQELQRSSLLLEQKAKISMQAMRMVSRALGLPAGRGAGVTAPPSASSSTSPPTTLPSQPVLTKRMVRPWYKEWWIWAVTGAVVIGASIAITATLAKEASPQPAAFDIQVHYLRF